MKEMTVGEMRQVQLGILDHVDALCRKNGISYWLDYGTLLGAVRHKGYIPWDDDIDISMFRADYDKFVDLCRNSDETKYYLSCVEKDKSCMYSIGKMIDRDTVLYELGEKGIRTGVYIDIFAVDGAPEDKKKLGKAFKRLDLYRRLRSYQLPMSPAPLSFKRMCVIIARGAVSLLPREFFTRKIVKNARKYAEPDSDYVSALTDPYNYLHWVMERRVFSELTELPFEGKKYPAPKAYDEWLRLRYGNYMELPPEEQQVRHDVRAFWLADFADD